MIRLYSTLNDSFILNTDISRAECTVDVCGLECPECPVCITAVNNFYIFSLLHIVYCLV